MSSAIVDASSERYPWLPWVLLAVGVAGASISAILIRYARDAEPLAISFWRCAAGAATLLPFARRRLGSITGRQAGLCLLTGAFLAVHFGTWITSLELTSIAASVLLVTSSPVFVALLSWWLLKDRLKAAAWLGIALTFVGTAVIAGGDLSGSALDGNLLALAGGITVAGYVFVGQIARRDLGIVEYAVVTYAAAAILLVVLCLLLGVPLWGYDTQTWVAIAALVIGPQLLGHTVLNFVLADIDATTVSVAVMAEPVVASALAFLLFSETPSALIYPGGAAILAGIYLVSVTRKPPAIVVE
ncbi:MAG: DMT family transporter [Actinomycetota bacterium]|nr:DMT family transporter [Actinomycetota bacterium]